MDKLGRNYSLAVQNQVGEFIIIKPPFTLEFDIQRNDLSSSSVASFRIKNLAKNTRKQIYKDEWNQSLIKEIIVRAGYGDNLPIIFQGNVTKAWSTREGVDVVTEIDCFDVGIGFTDAITDKVYPAGTSQREVIRDLTKSLEKYGVKTGAIGDYVGDLKRGNSYNGNTVDILRELTGDGFFIDNGNANCLSNNECVRGEILVINAETGLLGTPIKYDTKIVFDMLFEPRLVVNQKIHLESAINDDFNGDYKIVSISHKGTISPSVCGPIVTTVGVGWGNLALTVVPAAG